MAWRLAESIAQLRREVDALFPGRNKASDGTIGDAAHATRDSDHNPWVKDSDGVGVVRAIDITHDPDSGCDAGVIAESVRRMFRAGDDRRRYVIFNRRIASSVTGYDWEPYNGPNPHTTHVHVSVSVHPEGYDDRRSWGVAEWFRQEEEEFMAALSDEQQRELFRTTQWLRAAFRGLAKGLRVEVKEEFDRDEVYRAFRRTGAILLGERDEVPDDGVSG